MVVHATGLWWFSGYRQRSAVSRDKLQSQSGPDTFSFSSYSTISEQGMEVTVGESYRMTYLVSLGLALMESGMGSPYISIRYRTLCSWCTAHVPSPASL